jgi:hypothetical protein
MTNDELNKLITHKYGKCFWYDFFDTMDELNKELTYLKYVIINQWNEFGVTLVEIGDNNGWSCIVVVRNAYD